MSFLNEEEVRGGHQVNLAPMIDFLFLMTVFFATLAVSRVAVRDTEINLVKVQRTSDDSLTSEQASEIKFVNVSITEDGTYKWVTELRDYAMNSPDEIAQELRTEHEKGILPHDKSKTKVLLKIDRKAEWDPIMKLIFSIRDEGFEVRPLYEPDDTAVTEGTDPSVTHSSTKPRPG